MKEEDAIKAILADKNSALSELYYQYRGLFLSIHNLEQDVLEDIYQESFIELCQNIKAGKFQQKSSLKSYLFGIGRNKISAYMGEKNMYVDESFIDVMSISEQAYKEDSWNEKQERVFSLVLELKHPCNEVLKLYFWEEKSMREIAEAMGYGSEQVAKNRKLHCFRMLKGHVKEQFKKEGLL